MSTDQPTEAADTEVPAERDEAFANDPSEEKAREAAEQDAEVTTPSGDDAGGPIDTERWPAAEHHDPSESEARIDAEASVEVEHGDTEAEAERSVEAEKETTE
jgi:hypothetical protein